MDCRTAGVSAVEVGRLPFLTTTNCSRDRIALCGGFNAVIADGLTASSVLAAIAAGGGAADTIGPPVTTGEATALVACVVAMAVADVDAVTEDCAAAAVTGAIDAVVVVTGTAGVIVGAIDGDGSADGVDATAVDAVAVGVTVVVAAVVDVETAGVVADVAAATAGGCVSASFDGCGGSCTFVCCFLGRRGDDLAGGGRLTTEDLAGGGRLTTGDLADGCECLGVLGEPAGGRECLGVLGEPAGGRECLGVLGEPAGGNGDLDDDVTLRGCNGPPVGNFLRGDDFTAVAAVTAAVVGAGGGLLTVVVGFQDFDRSFVDTDSRCLAASRWRLAEIRGSDDCRLSGSDDGLAARDRPFSGVLKPLPRNGLTRPLRVAVAVAAAFGSVCDDEALAAGGSGNTTNAPRSLRRGFVLYASAAVTSGGCGGGGVEGRLAGHGGRAVVRSSDRR